MPFTQYKQDRTYESGLLKRNDLNASSIPLVQATGSLHTPLFLRAVIGVIHVFSSKVWKQHQPTKSSNGKQAKQGRDPISLLDLKVLLIHGFLGLVA